MQRSHLSYAFLLSFLATILLLRWWEQSSYLSVIWLSLAGMITASSLMGLRFRSSLLMFASALGVSMAFLAVAHATHVPNATSIDTYATGAHVTVRGIVSDEPDERPMMIKYTLSSTSFTQSGRTIPVQGKVLVTDPNGWPAYRYGDEVQVSGILERPTVIDDFAYDRYLARYSIYAVMNRPAMKRLSGNHGSKLMAALFGIKGIFEAQINRIQPEPHASFLAGLLTGTRRGIPDHLTQDFNATGLTHIIAISGTNITMIMMCVASLLFWLPLRWRFLPSVACIILFTLFVGASASVVRAAIMGILGLFALQAHRLTESRLLILWTACLMTAWNPHVLWDDAGFQLSFLAIISLSELSPFLEKPCARLPQAFGIRENLQATIAAQIGTWPWIAFLFGRFSVIAPLTNILVAPLVPFAMLFGFVGTCLSWIWFPLGQLVSYLAFGCMEWVIHVAEFSAHIPFASVNVAGMPGWIVVAMYGVMIAGVGLVKKKPI